MRSSDPERDQRAFEELAAACACQNFRRAARAVTQLFDDALAPSGLRSTQLIVLVNIGALEPISLGVLAKELGLEASTLHRNIRLLERESFVEKVASDNSRRVMVRLTEAGRQAAHNSLPYWQQAQDRFVAALGADTWEVLRDKISDVVHAASR